MRDIIRFTLLCAAFLTPALSARADAPNADVSSMSIEDLMNIEITSASKKEERVQDAAAAVFVLSHDDLIRAGVRTIPDALRLVPGIEVARVSGNQWAVTSRGLNGLFANDLLVLIDGRSVYTPLFSGVFWDVQNPMIEDIDRIEVIRGPGASLWGANAVTGVINIITKSAADTVGGLVTTGGGNYEQGYVDVRYGAKLSDHCFGRVYGTFENRDKTEEAGGAEEFDAWRNGQGGFRFDGKTDHDTFTFQGDLYQGFSGQDVTLFQEQPPFELPSRKHADFSGGDLLARWSEDIDKNSSAQLQAYWDRTERSGFVRFTYDLLDLDSEYRRVLFPSNELTTGGGFRIISDDLSGEKAVIVSDPSRTQGLANVFVQDDQSFLDSAVHFIAGTKLEHNEYTGLEVEPNVRLLWHPEDQMSVWAAYSHAVRTPSRVENNGAFNVNFLPAGSIPSDTLPGVVRIVGNTGLDSEELDAFEMGFRSQISREISFDIAAFLDKSTKLVGLRPVSQDVSTVGGDPHLLLTEQFANATSVDAVGVEPVLTWQALAWWRLQGWYSFLDESSGTAPHLTATVSQGVDPKHQASFRSSMDLSDSVKLDATFRYVGTVRDYGIDPYTEANARIAWQQSKRVEFSIGVMNLLHSKHQEYAANFIHVSRTTVPRMVSAEVKVNF